MNRAPSRSGQGRGRWIPLPLALAGLALLAAALTAAVRGNDRSTDADRLRGTDSSSPAAPANSTASRASLRSVDPQGFAIAVAQVLFNWSTAHGAQPSDLVGRLLSVADPTGVESPGLLSDIGNFVPPDSAWNNLRVYATRQRLEVVSAARPKAWQEAFAQAHSQVADGTNAVTIRGIRHRSGVWENQRVSSQHPVAFTVFVACRPAYPTCRLLRLSLPDRPLE